MKRIELTFEHIRLMKEYGLNKLNPKTIEPVSYSPGELILQEGLPIHWLAVVVSGKAKVCAMAPNGRNLVLCYYVSGGLIGDIELLAEQENATATMIAVTDFECIRIPYRNAAVLKTEPLFLNWAARELALKLVRSSENLISAALTTGEERLCSYILQASHHDLFRDVMTDVSCSIGLSYRHCFRLLNQLCAEGLLKKQDSGYQILDRTRLRQRAGFDDVSKLSGAPPQLTLKE